MVKYATAVSDKSKSKAIKWEPLLLGGLGFHLFYVGRIKAALVRFVLGALFWGLLIDGIAEGLFPLILSGIGCLIVFNIFDFVKLKLGTF